MHVPFSDLKQWSEYKGNLPKILHVPLTDRGCGGHRIKQELERCGAFLSLTEVADKYKEMEKLVSYSLFPRVVRNIEATAKGKLVLAPFTDYAGKVTNKKSEGASVITFQKNTLYVEAPPRPSAVDEASWPAHVLLAAYWWIGTTPDVSIANMELKTEDHSGFKCTVAKNIRALEANEKLMRFVAKVDKAKVSPNDFAKPPKADDVTKPQKADDAAKPAKAKAEGPTKKTKET